MKPSMFTLTVMASFLFATCDRFPGAGSSSATYAISGTEINLAGTGGSLQLEDKGSDSLLVHAHGTFTFPTALASGSAYGATVPVQSSSSAQSSGVMDGTGKVANNVAGATVDSEHKGWTWVNGANVVKQPGTYGTQGTAAPGNIPGARTHAVTWTDAAGNLWLFGGWGYASAAGTWGNLNDLWKYSAGQWTWMGGSKKAAKEASEPGTYGTQGTAASGNVPGARSGAVGWTDAAGNLWLFGGEGYDSAGTRGEFNDLWKYGDGQWTWMGGSKVVNQPGTYGTQGMAAPSNIPWARSGAVGWTDAAGNFWLFGGSCVTEDGSAGSLNDLWKYSVGQWTWMGGSKVPNAWQPHDKGGKYGTQGKAAPGNVPGARSDAAGWADAAGNFWLFGGSGYDSTGFLGELNDLWKYSAGQWTWMGGSKKAAKEASEPGTYGTQGTPASGNVPGARTSAATWTDAAGNLWLFGGDTGGVYTYINDLWKYGDGQWTWMGGSKLDNQPGTYGTQGTAASGNVPGARAGAVTWTDGAGNLWVFGGEGYDSAGTWGELNDLWKYER